MRSARTVKTAIPILGLLLLAAPSSGAAQGVLTGQLLTGRWPGSRDLVPLTAVYVFASLPGSDSEALSFRTWETHPAGWYRLSGPSGRYTIVFSNPAHFMRPIVLTNVYVQGGEVLNRIIHPRFDFHDFHEGQWDTKPARGYYQTFTAAGSGITHVGFKLATDGVDGPGPGSQELLVSIHRGGEGNPDAWEQVGPTAHVPGVDCGGVKGYWYSAGWQSGEVPVQPGGAYAVYLRPENPRGRVQAFWRASDDPREACYRLGDGDGDGAYQHRRIWLAVAGDGDGLVIPYNKRIHTKFERLTRFGRKWSQTYVARGRSIASVILFAAVGGTQPPIGRQRVRIRVRRGGPEGPAVGVEKIACGNGNYTGDASWGVFGAAFSPEEVPVEPGATYAVEFESIENYNTLHGFVNIKGQVSDDRPGFNPYRKCAGDGYEKGTAYFFAKEDVGYDLDMQVIEYEHAAENWREAVEGDNLLENGDMETGTGDARDSAGLRAASWTPFTIEAGTGREYFADGPGKTNRVLRVARRKASKAAVDGGYVQRVEGLEHLATYRLAARVRSSWAVSSDRECLVGCDPTGQTENPRADTIVWKRLPAVHGVFVSCRLGPVRPRSDSISVWLRARSAREEKFPFTADFDDVVLQRVPTGVPAASRWPSWRGPESAGSTGPGPYAVKWSASENLAWKAELPGVGRSTPIVWDDHIIITCPDGGQDSVIDFTGAGELRWKTVLGKERKGKHRNASGSNPSPATDGKGIFAYFKSGTLAALDFEGKVLWRTNLQERFGKDTVWWDIGTSPVLTRACVVVAVQQAGDSYVAAFEKATGRVSWKVPRNYSCALEGDQSYTTPIVFSYRGREAILVWGAEHLTVHDAAGGKILWSCGGFNPDRMSNWVTVASPVICGETAVLPYGRGDLLIGVQLGGEGDLAGGHGVWTRKEAAAFVPSLATQGGKVYVVRDRGEVLCVDGATGKGLWSRKLPKHRAKYYASPTVAGGKLYAAREDGAVFVVGLTGEHEVLSRNEIGENLIASPVPAGGRIFLRGDRHLFCVAPGAATGFTSPY